VSGIVAVIDGSGAPVDRLLLERMTGCSLPGARERQRSWADGGVGLGHVPLRLTTELGAERRPSTLDGSAWLTADARIDGRDELVRALQAQDRRVEVSATDDQLILHAYGVWGEGCVEHLIGDFAFVIWDMVDRRLFCARDQFGVTPLYYATVPCGLVVSNAVRSIRAHPAVSDELDERVIGDFLLAGRNLDVSATTFADVRALPPAHTLTWAGDRARVRRYWNLPQEVELVRRAGPQDHVERFAAVFGQAVGDRVRADAIGTQLSGGLDSTSIAVTANRVMKARGLPFALRAYTVTFEWLIAEEERRYAEQVAALLGVPVEYLVAEDYMTRAPDPAPAWVFPEPWGIAEQSPDYEVTRRVARFAPVLLSGLGGDPLLATGLASAGWRDVARAAARTRQLPRFGLRTAVRTRRQRPRELTVPDWINPAFARRIDLAARQAQIESLSRHASTREAMLAGFWVDVFRSAHPGALGLPVKMVFPFFDVRLVRCVLETPPLPWREDKRLLREAMRGQLPEAVRVRPKTSLYGMTQGGDERHPLYRLGLRAETRRWRRQLISTPAMAEFLDVPRALALVEAPPPSGQILTGFEHSFPLAHWLSHQRSGATVDGGSAPRGKGSDARRSVSQGRDDA
jgi:asparagine synthase (glutamine-hydrolysing)